MALRTVALCNGTYIGIETIYTVIDGKQINIPEKLKELRAKSRNNELFCPCGCGANLVLVAGDKNLREQHFRIKDGREAENCTVSMEGKTSLDSKIVLKCWLDECLRASDLQSRVPICDVADSSRRYEFTFLSKSLGIALDYCHNRANLSDEKQSVLDQNSQGIRIIHVVDEINGGSDGQYPEGLMKIQNKQRYCLLLTVADSDYKTAKMKAAFYAQDLDGLWHENVFANGLLRDYRIDPHGAVSWKGVPLDSMYEAAAQRFRNLQDAENRRREEENRRREERVRQQQEWARQQQAEAEKRLEEERNLRAIVAERQRMLAEETAKRLAKEAEDRRIAAEKAQEERRLREEKLKEEIAPLLEQQERQVRDSEGKRWIKCELCGKIARESEFAIYGGAIGVHLNLGKCKECLANLWGR